MRLGPDRPGTGRVTIDHGLLEALAAPAAECALDFARRRAGIAVEEKTRGQFASEADRRVEEVIRASLRAAFGEVALLGEEGGGDLGPDGTGWVIDPIDGTTNFLRGLPLWAISIGYVAKGEPVAGVIVLPELGETLSAVRGGGVWRNGATMAGTTVPEAVKLISLGENDHEPGAASDARAQGLREQGWAVARYNCAVFSLAGAALGWSDGYIEHGCALWDIAAGAVVCREAGLDVAMWEIAPGRYAIEARR
jgi:myo-inositol-1(or 4)-monophosphatase